MPALSGIRVIEVAHGVAGEYCGKLLSDFGAEVIKVEPPEGSPVRRLPPFSGAGRGGGHCASDAGRAMRVRASTKRSMSSVVTKLAQEMRR